MKSRGICNNILLEHEGETPEWIAVEADKAIRLCESTRDTETASGGMG